jgi:hypothetical protein
MLAAYRASLECADIGTIDPRAMRELFLRQAVLLPQPPQIERQNLSDMHLREGIGL